MSDLHDQESEFARFVHRLPDDDALRPEHRDALREQALAAFDRAGQSHTSVWWKRAINQGREIMKRPIPRLIAVSVACVAVAALWLFVPGHQSTAQAFNALAETLMAAKTAHFQMEVQVEGQPKQKFDTYFMAPAKYRQELPNVVNITDLTAGKIVTIMPLDKRVMVMNIKGELNKQASISYFDRVRELLGRGRDAKDEPFKNIGEKEIDGKRAVGFRFESRTETVTLWGDPKTGQPVRIETLMVGVPRTEVTMTNFEINVDVKESQFDQTPPAGYKVQSMDVDASPPDEPALVEGFKAFTELSDGDFPDALDTLSVSRTIAFVVAKNLTDKGKDVSDEIVQELMKQSVTIGRGFQFALQLPDSGEPHYAGKGVKRDAVDRPIFWYKPDGAATYRVIYADLSIKDANAAPQVPEAKRIGKPVSSSAPRN